MLLDINKLILEWESKGIIHLSILKSIKKYCKKHIVKVPDILYGFVIKKTEKYYVYKYMEFLINQYNQGNLSYLVKK